MRLINVDQHKKKIRNRHDSNFTANVFATGAGMITWLVLFSVMGWAVVSEPVSPRPYLSYPDKGALLQHTKVQVSRADVAYIDDMELAGRVKTKETRKAKRND